MKLLVRISLTAVLFAGISACSPQRPLLSPYLLPQSYSDQSGILSDRQSPDAPFFIIAVNDDRHLNRKIIQFWLRGHFSTQIRKKHPYLQFDQSDILAVQDALNQIFDIYYIGNLARSTIISWSSIQLGTGESACQPLSEYEIQFLMNSEPSNAFPQVPFTMLMISIHELMLQKGAKPIYPRINSTFLKTSFEIAEQNIRPIEHFPDGKSKKDSQAIREGFVFCRK